MASLPRPASDPTHTPWADARLVDSVITWPSRAEACKYTNNVSQRVRLEPAEPIILEATPGELWFGAWGALNAVIWMGPATADMVARINHGLDVRYEALNHERMSTVHVVLPGVRPPDADA